ncbi:hypothetical protein D7Z94_24265 [Ulvibacterium marinum]|uniref:Uncharacterized protein n=1 Tax=Ulvibacterium marinum TaxID=2419782 RepID=A0A3B0BYG7_9FLAO|nr:hypothetical protein D7Z94_24265 [Ulvibacterium marinum]
MYIKRKKYMFRYFDSKYDLTHFHAYFQNIIALKFFIKFADKSLKILAFSKAICKVIVELIWPFW